MMKHDRPPRFLSGLSGIADHYDALLCDVWGVLHNGAVLYKQAATALRAFRAKGGTVALVTNSPRPSARVEEQVRGLGLTGESYDIIVTSGDATRAALQAHAPGPAFRLGPGRDDPLYEGLGLEFSDLEQARFIACSGLFDDRRETPEHYRDLLTRARERNLSMVCVNPDLQVEIAGRLIYCGGALAALYEQMGGQVVYAGKPHPPIYDLAFRRFETKPGRHFSKKQVLAIGDGLMTDIKGACLQGIDALYIAGRLHADEIEEKNGDISVMRLQESLKRRDLDLSYVMPALCW